jgi:hypothetical protein
MIDFYPFIKRNSSGKYLTRSQTRVNDLLPVIYIYNLSVVSLVVYSLATAILSSPAMLTRIILVVPISEKNLSIQVKPCCTCKKGQLRYKF